MRSGPTGCTRSIIDAYVVKSKVFIKMFKAATEEARHVYTSSKWKVIHEGNMKCVSIKPNSAVTKPWWQVDMGASSIIHGVKWTRCSKTLGK